MNTSFFCHPCKRAFASLDEYVKHNTKKQCVTNDVISRFNQQNQAASTSTTTTNVMNVDTTATTAEPIVAVSTESANVQPTEFEPVQSNISSPMAASSPMSEDTEQQVGNIWWLLYEISLCQND